MATTTVNTRICVRRDVTANWDAHPTFIPLLGEVIAYMDHRQTVKDGSTVNIPGIKIGDGVNYLINLPFIEGGSADYPIYDGEYEIT